MSQIPPQTEPSKWEVEHEELYADCKIYKVYKQHCIHPGDNREGDFYVMDFPDWVQVLALTPSREIIMVQQYRFGSGELSWEVPGGVLEPGEHIIDGGKRELFEETGFSGTNAQIIGVSYPNPALQNNKTHYILLEDCIFEGGHTHDHHEEFRVKVLPLDQAFKWIAHGEITHTIAMSAFQFLKLHLEKNEYGNSNT